MKRGLDHSKCKGHVQHEWYGRLCWGNPNGSFRTAEEATAFADELQANAIAYRERRQAWVRGEVPA